MDSLKNGWFSEFSEMWKGQSMSLEIEEVLYQGKSKFQDVMILKRCVEAYFHSRVTFCNLVN